MATDATNRRKYARLDLALTVSYAPLDSSGAPTDPREALSSDLSAGGLRLMMPTQSHMGAQLDLMIYLEGNDDEPVHATGEVLWQNKISPTSFETGVAIRSMPDPDKRRFMEFVFDQMTKVVTHAK
jgi:c-di-GMP-binding flagellar brake protein YcgR